MDLVKPQLSHPPMGVAIVALIISLLVFAGIQQTITTVTPASIEPPVLPLAFIPNAGQYPSEVKFQTQGKNSELQFFQDEVVLHLPSDPAVRLQWVGSNPTPPIEGSRLLPGVVNVIRGNDPAAWLTKIPMMAGITYEGLYAGIDLAYDGNEGTLKGTYTVAPHTDASQIRWQFQGSTALAVEPTTGNLEVNLPSGAIIVEAAPIAWQTIDGVQQAVDVAYAVEGDIVAFTFPNGYDAAHKLVIDPTLRYSTYLGGRSTDEAKGVSYDATGNIYITGETISDDLLGYDTTPVGSKDIFVTKLNPTGTSIVYLTMMGSSETESPLAIKNDANGNAYVTAYTFGDDFPTHNALWDAPPTFADNGVLFKLNGSGAIEYSTYLPLDMFDSVHNLAVDGAGNAYATGAYFSNGDPFLGDQVGLYKISPDGGDVLLEKNYGGADNSTEIGVAVALDGAGNIYIVGEQDRANADRPITTTPNAHQPLCGDILYGGTFCFHDTIVYVINAAGNVTYASYHGGSFTDEPTTIATDGKGNILIAGNTTSGQFPLVNALQTTCPLDDDQDCTSPRGFVSMIHLDPTQSTLAYSTYWGDAERASTTKILAGAMDSAGNAYVTGYTDGLDFPIKDPVQAELSPSVCFTFGSQRPCFDAFISQFSPNGQLAFGTYFGAPLDEFPYDITLTPNGNLTFVGTTEADDFPTTEDAIQPDNPLNDDGFLVTLGLGTMPPPPTATATATVPTGSTPTVTVTPGGPTVTPIVTVDPTLKKNYLPLLFGRGN